MASPMEQFKINPLVEFQIAGHEIDFTNSALFMVIGVVLSTLIFGFCVRKLKTVPGTAQSFMEMLCSFVRGIIIDSAGKEGLKYFPFIFCVFTFVAFGNLLGLLPYSFTYTSHGSAVGSLALLALIVNIWVGISHKGWGWLHTFFPKGIPAPVGIILVPIEMIAMVSKPFSLTVRLVANMTVGHVMLKTVAGFVYGLGIVGGIAPILFMVFIYTLETGFALLQAYIFTVLSCIYLSDALHDH